MKVPDTEIRDAIITALTGVITVPVRDMVARPDDNPPWVLLSSQTDSQRPLKTENGHDCTILIQIIGEQNLLVNRYQVEQIADKILGKLLPISVTNYMTLPNFDIINIELDSMTDDVINSGTGLTARKLIRLRLIIREKI